MTHRLLSVVFAATTIAIFAPVAKADAPKEVKTVKNKAIALSNLLSAPNNCSNNPGPIPLPRLFEKPSHGSVRLQIVMANVPAAACPARKIPSIVLFYTPRKDFVGKDSLRVEFEAGDVKMPDLGFLITVEDTEGK